MTTERKREANSIPEKEIAMKIIQEAILKNKNKYEKWRTQNGRKEERV